MGFTIDDLDMKNSGLYVALALSLVAGLYVLSDVFWTVFLAGTFAYVLYPLTRRLRSKGFSERQSAALTTFLSFSVLLLFFVPVFLVLFERRQIIIDFMVSLPEEFTFQIFDFSLSYSTEQLEAMAVEWITAAAVTVAEAVPGLLLRVMLFVFILYAIMRYPDRIKDSVVGITPNVFNDVLYSYHERVEKTLVGIFAVQALTAVLTFVIALPVFYFLGYQPFVFLSLLSALLQFIPVIGPSLVILALVALELSVGLIGKAVLILVLGIVIIGFLPDAYLRPKMAGKTTGLPASLYFLGFVGGGLTLGAIGVLAGPLVIAFILETVELLKK